MDFPIFNRLLPQRAMWVVIVFLLGSTFDSCFPITIRPESKWRETTLYMGRSKNGQPISDQDFKVFVDTVAKRWLPNGFTIVSGYGTWRGRGGNALRENSSVLIVAHPRSGEITRAIDSVARYYCYLFNQESVLRVEVEADAEFVTIQPK